MSFSSRKKYFAKRTVDVPTSGNDILIWEILDSPKIYLQKQMFKINSVRSGKNGYHEKLNANILLANQSENHQIGDISQIVQY